MPLCRRNGFLWPRNSEGVRRTSAARRSPSGRRRSSTMIGPDMRDSSGISTRASRRADLARPPCWKWRVVYDILIFERTTAPAAIECWWIRALRASGLVSTGVRARSTYWWPSRASSRTRTISFEPWNRHIRELARRPNVYCKLSGMVTEADWSGWSDEQLRPYIDTVLEAFGPARLMFGSDWPVCLVASTYRGWRETVGRLTGQLSTDEQARLFGGTAIGGLFLERLRVRQASLLSSLRQHPSLYR